MQVTVTQETSWQRALNAARRTVGKAPLNKEPSDKFKINSMMSEHSQIKLVEWLVSFESLKQWVGVHLLRHSFILPFIHSQRGDRRELRCKRDDLPQGEPNDQDFVINSQSLINISRRRLCRTASKETQEAWQAVKDRIAEQDPITARFMVRNCVYRGFCPEAPDKCCGFVKTKQFLNELTAYREGFTQNMLKPEEK